MIHKHYPFSIQTKEQMNKYDKLRRDRTQEFRNTRKERLLLKINHCNKPIHDIKVFVGIKEELDASKVLEVFLGKIFLRAVERRREEKRKKI